MMEGNQGYGVFFSAETSDQTGGVREPHNRSCREIDDTGYPQYEIGIHSTVSAGLRIFFSSASAHRMCRGRLIPSLPPRDRLQKKTHRSLHHKKAKLYNYAANPRKIRAKPSKSAIKSP